MARITKNLFLSGKVGHLVFATQGNTSYVRSLPSRVKQTKNTKKAASRFGFCSEKDKIYRVLLQNYYKIYTDSRYAARHRALLLKTITETEPTAPKPYTFSTPNALQNFCFNSQYPWDKLMRFYPTYTLLPTGDFIAQLPQLQWGQQIRPQKNTQQAGITFYAFTLNLNTSPITIQPITHLELILQANETIAAQSWTFNVPINQGWLIILATAVLQNNTPKQPHAIIGTSSYVFAANCGD